MRRLALRSFTPRGLALTAFALALTACASGKEHTAGEGIGQASAPIINGVVDKPAKYPSAFLIETLIDASTGQAAGCTGTLISPHVMITARHCVSSLNEATGVFGADWDAANMLVWYGPEPYGKEDLKVARVVHPPGDTIDNNDFAMLVLKSAATKPFAPIRLAAPPKVSEKTAVAGFGLTTSDTGMPTSLHARYRRENVSILVVGPEPMYGLGSKEMIMGESTCHGDSGGPVYDQASGALLALTSRGGNGSMATASQPWAGCTGGRAYNIFTRVDGFADLINKTVGEVGEKVWEEGTPMPMPPSMPTPDPGMLGSICAGPKDCASTVCVAYNGAQVCSQACSDTKACPAGFDCVSNFCFKHVDDPTMPPADPGTTPAADPANPDAPPTSSKGGCSIGVRGTDTSDSLATLLLVGAGLMLGLRRR